MPDLTALKTSEASGINGTFRANEAFGTNDVINYLFIINDYYDLRARPSRVTKKGRPRSVFRRTNPAMTGFQALKARNRAKKVPKCIKTPLGRLILLKNRKN